MIPSEKNWCVQHWERIQNRSKQGFVSREFIDKQGVMHNYAVYVPHQLKVNEKPPLIVFLHGAGEKGTDGTKPLLAGIGPAIWESKRHFPFVVLFPQYAPSFQDNTQDQYFQRVMQMIDFTISEYNIDPDRISVTGISMGANQCWDIADQYPDRFAAVCPLSASCAPKLIKQVVSSNTAVWNFYVRGDDPLSGDRYRQLYPKLLASGYSPRFTELDGTLSTQWWKHNAWDYATRNTAFLSWLLQQNRSKNQTERPFEVISPDAESPRWQINDPTWTISSQATLDFQGTHSAPSPPARYLNEFQNYELHLQFKVNQGNGCSLQYFKGLKTNESGFLKMDIVTAEQGSGGVLEYPEQKWLASSKRLAQHAFVPNEWNELRLKVSQSQLNVELNGWGIYSLKKEDCSQLNGDFALSVPDSTTGNVQWRYLRIREME
ncbi:carboxylesterase family protein [Gimesia fumaroli]|nr:family 16 glycoside hydrolase [Gimesia fumaroli]